MHRDRPSPRRTRAWIAALAAGALVAASAILWPTPARPGATVIAVFAPWQAQGAVLRDAARDGVHILGEGPVPGSVLVVADDTRALVRLYGAGAWTILSLDGLAGCFGASAQARAGRDGSGA